MSVHLQLHNVQRACHSKRRYLTQVTAEAKARRCTEKRGMALRVYHCPYCLGFHLTKQVGQ